MTSDGLIDINHFPRLPDVPPPGETDVVASPDAKPRKGAAKTGAIAGIAATAALAIGLGVAVTSNGSSTAQANGGLSQQAGPGGQGGFGGPPGAQNGTGAGTQTGPGGATGLGTPGGGQLVMGSVTAVTTSSVTVKTTTATTTYGVNSDTQVIVNGAAGKLSAIAVGTSVLVQAPTTGSAATATAIIIGGFDGQGGRPRGTANTT